MGAACRVMRNEGPLAMGVSAAGNAVLWVALLCLNLPWNQNFVCFSFKVTGLAEGFHSLDFTLLGSAVQLPCPTNSELNFFYSPHCWKSSGIKDQLCSVLSAIFFKRYLLEFSIELQLHPITAFPKSSEVRCGCTECFPFKSFNVT